MGQLFFEEESIYEIQTPKYGYTHKHAHMHGRKSQKQYAPSFFKVWGITKMLLFHDAN